MKGIEIKKLFPKFAEKYKIQDTDFLYLDGDKIKVLKEGRTEKYGSLSPPHQDS